MAEVGLDEFGGYCLGGAKLAEGDDDLFVYCATVL